MARAEDACPAGLGLTVRGGQPRQEAGGTTFDRSRDRPAPRGRVRPSGWARPRAQGGPYRQDKKGSRLNLLLRALNRIFAQMTEERSTVVRTLAEIPAGR